MQRNFTPMVNAVNSWREIQLTDAAAKLFIYRAFIEDGLEAFPMLELAEEIGRMEIGSASPSGSDRQSRTSQRRRIAGPSGQLEPLCAVYHSRCRAAIHAALDRGVRNVIDLYVACLCTAAQERPPAPAVAQRKSDNLAH